MGFNVYFSIADWKDAFRKQKLNKVVLNLNIYYVSLLLIYIDTLIYT